MYGQSTFRMTNGGPPSGGPRSLFRPSALSGVANNLIKKQEDELKEKETAQRSAEKHKPSEDDAETISAKKPALEQDEAAVPKAKEEDSSVIQSAEQEANTSSNASTSASVNVGTSASASAGASANSGASASVNAGASAGVDENSDASANMTINTSTNAPVQAEADKDTKPKQEAEDDATAKTATGAKYDFVFGENVKDRVLLRATNSDPRKIENGQQKTDDESSTKKEDTEAAVATEDTAKATDSDSKVFKGGASDSTKSNTEPARPPEELLTGEEGERNVLQVFGRLFVFNGVTKNWQERGRGYFRLNDVESQKQVQLTVQGHSHVTAEQQLLKSDETKPESSEASHLPDAINSAITGETEKGQFVAPTSRIVMRRHGTQSVMLNSPVFAKMEVGRVDDKRLRFTAQCVDEAGLHTVRIFCVTAASKDVQALYDALLQRRDQLVSLSSAPGTGGST